VSGPNPGTWRLAALLGRVRGGRATNACSRKASTSAASASTGFESYLTAIDKFHFYARRELAIPGVYLPKPRPTPEAPPTAQPDPPVTTNLNPVVPPLTDMDPPRHGGWTFEGVLEHGRAAIIAGFAAALICWESLGSDASAPRRFETSTRPKIGIVVVAVVPVWWTGESARSTSGGRQMSDDIDRAAGVLLGGACGDALGVPYEFQRRLTGDERPQMLGGGLGPYEPGEYSDDTQMAVCIAEVAATGADLRTDEALDAIAANFLRWRHGGASDIGAQTEQVIAAVPQTQSDGAGAAMRAAAAELHQRTGRTAGNGSLMRTGPVALAYLQDPTALAQAARAASELTHHDPLAGDACVLWCAGIRRAVLNATFDGVREGLDLLPTERREQWAGWLDEAAAHLPHHFSPNGFVVPAVQAAWSAITRTPVPDDRPGDGIFASQHLQQALEASVRAGDDTDTVAAIAGALLGARWGASAVPLPWQAIVHGWPGLRAPDLIRLAVLTAHGGRTDAGVLSPGRDEFGVPRCPVPTRNPAESGLPSARNGRDDSVLTRDDTIERYLDEPPTELPSVDPAWSASDVRLGPVGNNVYVEGRRVYVVTGSSSQTVNICSAANVRSRYEWIYRLRGATVTKAEVAAHATLDSLRNWLVQRSAVLEVGTTAAVALGLTTSATYATVRIPDPVTVVPPSGEWLDNAVRVVETAIDSLVWEFVEHPYLHRVEHSLHARLFGILAAHPLLSHLLPIGTSGRFTQPVHKEWPETIPREEKDGRRGNFDLAVLSRQQLSQATVEDFRAGTIHASIVIEMGLDYPLEHLRQDHDKLVNSQVAAGFLVHFQRGRSRDPRLEEYLLDEQRTYRTAYAHHSPDGGCVFKTLDGGGVLRTAR
jgi:ADP-ribosylglycohydrolase